VPRDIARVGVSGAATPRSSGGKVGGKNTTPTCVCVYTLVYILYRIIETNYNDVQRQSSRDRMKDNKSIVAYWNMKQKWGRELCIDRCKLSANVG